MILAVAVSYLLLHALPLVALGVMSRRRIDILSPIPVLTLLHLLSFPYLFLLGVDRSFLSPHILISPIVQDVPTALGRYVAIASAAFLATASGIVSPLANRVARRLPTIPAERFTRARCSRAILFTAVAGGALYLYFLSLIGGLRNLWVVLYNRTLVTAGTGYLSTAYELLLTFAAILLVYSLRFRLNPTRRVLVALGLIVVAVVLASTGGRSGVLLLALYAALTYHHQIRPIRTIFSPKMMLAGGMLVLFMLAMPLFRSAGAFERLSSSPALLLQESLGNVSRLSRDLSGADRGMVVVTYFSRPDRLWWGSSYRDLLVAPIPRRFMPNKPPVDDGVYLMGIAQGNEVRPSLPASELPVTSWPPGTWAVYMNFGFLPFLFGSWLLGLVIGTMYHYMRASRATPLSIFLYGFVLLGGLSWSNYGIAVFLTSMAVTIPVFWLLFASKGLERWLGSGGSAPAQSRHPAPGPG